MMHVNKWIAGIMSVVVFTLFLPQIAGAGEKDEFWLDSEKEEISAQSIDVKASPMRKIPEKEEKDNTWWWVAGGVVLGVIIGALAAGGGDDGGSSNNVELSW